MRSGNRPRSTYTRRWHFTKTARVFVIRLRTYQYWTACNAIPTYAREGTMLPMILRTADLISGSCWCCSIRVSNSAIVIPCISSGSTGLLWATNLQVSSKLRIRQRTTMNPSHWSTPRTNPSLHLYKRLRVELRY